MLNYLNAEITNSLSDYQHKNDEGGPITSINRVPSGTLGNCSFKGQIFAKTSMSSGILCTYTHIFIATYSFSVRIKSRSLFLPSVILFRNPLCLRTYVLKRRCLHLTKRTKNRRLFAFTIFTSQGYLVMNMCIRKYQRYIETLRLHIMPHIFKCTTALFSAETLKLLVDSQVSSRRENNRRKNIESTYIP
nr:PREDICTED: uncharacterized protein LOC105662173 [Megachile rotundata]